MSQKNLIGQIVGGCRVDSYIGKGGMGQVFLARNLNLDIPVALKVMSTSLVKSEELINRFILEARAAARLDSENIVRVYYVGEEQGLYFLQMEYVEGESLQSYLKREAPLDIPLALCFLQQIVKGLHNAHTENIIHRDIKPDNILIHRKGILKIADFGLVKLIAEDNNLTATGQVMGTPYYISPEQCEGKSADARSDIYSLGIVLFYMLANQLPFDGDSSIAIVVARLQNEAPMIKSIRKDVPEEIEKFISKMLARKVEDRYQNTEELLDDIAYLMDTFAKNYKYSATNLNLQLPVQNEIANTSGKNIFEPCISSQQTLVGNSQAETSEKTISQNLSEIHTQTIESPFSNFHTDYIKQLPNQTSLQTESQPLVSAQPLVSTQPQIKDNSKSKSYGFLILLLEIIIAMVISTGLLYQTQQKIAKEQLHPNSREYVEYKRLVVESLENPSKQMMEKISLFVRDDNDFHYDNILVELKDDLKRQLVEENRENKLSEMQKKLEQEKLKKENLEKEILEKFETEIEKKRREKDAQRILESLREKINKENTIPGVIEIVKEHEKLFQEFKEVALQKLKIIPDADGQLQRETDIFFNNFFRATQGITQQRLNDIKNFEQREKEDALRKKQERIREREREREDRRKQITEKQRKMIVEFVEGIPILKIPFLGGGLKKHLRSIERSAKKGDIGKAKSLLRKLNAPLLKIKANELLKELEELDSRK